jgi:hypothetical protein
MNLREFIGGAGRSYLYYVATDDGSMFVNKISEEAADDIDLDDDYSGEHDIYDEEELFEYILDYVLIAWENANDVADVDYSMPAEVNALARKLYKKALALPESMVLEDGSVEDDENKTLSLWIGDVEQELKKSNSFTDRLKKLAGINKP